MCAQAGQRHLFNIFLFSYVSLSSFQLFANDWPGLRGPHFDGSVPGIHLFDQGKAGLKVTWKRPLGSGYSTVVVGGGRVFAVFTDGEDDLAASFDAASGEELWRYPLDPVYKGYDGSHDGPLASPALGDTRLHVLSPRGKLLALEADSGKEIWATDVVTDHGGTRPKYGFTSSPVLVDGILVVGIGGGEGRAIAGFDAATGAWKWGVGNGQVQYHSPVVATLAGQRQVLAADRETLYGIDPTDGTLLWSHPHQGDAADIGGGSIIPLPAGNDRLFLLYREDASVMLQVTAREGGYEARELWTTQSIRRSYVQPVIHEGFLYGMNNRIFSCISAETGALTWRSREPGDGFPTLVGDHLVVITKPGTLHIVEATPEEYREVASLDLFHDQSWSAVAFADGSLYGRSMGELARIDPAAVVTEAAAERPPWLGETAFGRFLAEVEQAADRDTMIDAFLARQDSFPIVEPSGAVHFLYRGEAQDVGIVGDMIGYRREDPMIRVADTDLFYYSTRLEPDASVTYGFLPDFSGQAIADPWNPQLGLGLFGAVSWFAMPGRRVPDFAAEAPNKGRLETVEWQSAKLGAERSAQVYLPAGYDSDPTRRYPTVYIHDGATALQFARLTEIFDHVIGHQAQPVIVVFIPPDPANPNAAAPYQKEYYARVAGELVPLIDRQFRTRPDRLARATFGLGYGGGAALRLLFQHTDLFGKAVSQSAFIMDADREFGDVVGGSDRWNTQIYQAWGGYDVRAPHEAWSIVESNRRLWQMLRERGFRPAGGERPEGFGWQCWRDHVGAWLATLFPPAATPAPGMAR